jgi:hypothetical protein
MAAHEAGGRCVWSITLQATTAAAAGGGLGVAAPCFANKPTGLPGPAGLRRKSTHTFEFERRFDSDITAPSRPLCACGTALESRHCALVDALFLQGCTAFSPNENCAFDISTNLTLISASRGKFGASLTALSPPLVLQAGARFLDRIFTLFPMVRGSLLAEVGRALVFCVFRLVSSVFSSFRPGAPQVLTDCDCLVRF